MSGRRTPVLGALVLAALLSSCGHGSSTAPARLSWSSASLPARSQARAVVQSAVWCGDRWYVAGATADRRGDTRPALWTSADARTWRALRLRPGDDYYAARAILTSVGCWHDRVAALGAKPGGAHGNPRVETWRQLADGSLAAVPAPFEQYGGQDAVSVNRLAGGGGGYLASGTRVTGAAVWDSATGARFTLHEDVPGLASTRAASTQALDAAWWHGSWLVVGDTALSDGRLVATSWSGAGDGPWTPTRLPGGTRVTTGERVTVTPEGPAVAGLADRRFGLWVDDGGRWTLASTFGTQQPGSTSPVFVSGLAVTGDRLAVTYSDGHGFRLALGPASALSGVPLPAAVTVRGDHTVMVAAHDDDLLLLTDDGSGARVWLAHP